MMHRSEEKSPVTVALLFLVDTLFAGGETHRGRILMFNLLLFCLTSCSSFPALSRSSILEKKNEPMKALHDECL